MITIIDYGVGNINAFRNVFKRIDVKVNTARTSMELQDAEKIILPGVGHFDFAMERLDSSGMRSTLDELVLEKNIPVIGICVGMQMMASSSEEGALPGLNWIKGEVKKFDETKISLRTKLPHMGWNDVKPFKDSPLFSGLETEAIFYFLHSFFFECSCNDDILAISNYGGKFASAVRHRNIYGIQFHPEKSHRYGELLLQNFSKL